MHDQHKLAFPLLVDAHNECRPPVWAGLSRLRRTAGALPQHVRQPSVCQWRFQLGAADSGDLCDRPRRHDSVRLGERGLYGSAGAAGDSVGGRVLSLRRADYGCNLGAHILRGAHSRVGRIPRGRNRETHYEPVALVGWHCPFDGGRVFFWRNRWWWQGLVAATFLLIRTGDSSNKDGFCQRRSRTERGQGKGVWRARPGKRRYTRRRRSCGGEQRLNFAGRPCQRGQCRRNRCWHTQSLSSSAHRGEDLPIL